MKLTLVLLLVALAPLSAADHVWQHGTWRDVQHSSDNGGSLTVPIGGTPPTVIAGVAVGGTAPTYLSFPMTVNTECVTIDSPDRIRYEACWQRRFKHVIVNDPIDFAVEGEKLFVRGDKKGESFRLAIVKATRLEPVN